MRTILITGISKGLGLKLADSFSIDNSNLVIGCSRTMTTELRNLMNTRNNIEWHQLDLADFSELEHHLIDIIDGRQIHCVINNAAILYKSLLVKADVNQFKKMIDVNLAAPMVVCKVAIENFLRWKTKGNILFYSSICAHMGFSGLSMIGATKGALESMSKNIAYEYGRKGIRSNVISIGLLDTGMSNTVNEKQYLEIINKSNIAQCADSDSVIELTRYLLSSNSMSVTGQVFHINCGIL